VGGHWGLILAGIVALEEAGVGFEHFEEPLEAERDLLERVSLSIRARRGQEGLRRE
jgi:hypothetical protein